MGTSYLGHKLVTSSVMTMLLCTYLRPSQNILWKQLSTCLCIKFKVTFNISYLQAVHCGGYNVLQEARLGLGHGPHNDHHACHVHLVSGTNLCNFWALSYWTTSVTSGQSYKGSKIIINNLRVLPDLKIPHIKTLES